MCLYWRRVPVEPPTGRRNRDEDNHLALAGDPGHGSRVSLPCQGPFYSVMQVSGEWKHDAGNRLVGGIACAITTAAAAHHNTGGGCHGHFFGPKFSTK